ncbi:MAG: hypothetical protein JO233_00600, partial [Candidatus Eremiobacteraeota bacterium]|nr:hypothetical protein [Candidatus Eremiobacteraeota bacterium]
MGCTAFQPGLTAREQARFLYETVPPGLFKVEGDEAKVPWRVAPEPFALSQTTYDKILRIGDDLFAFYKALNALYTRSARGTAPSFIAEYLDQGKPEHIVRLSRQNRFKGDLPAVIRPDLILTDDGMIASELDSVPGGMGFVGAMAEAYCKLGMESIGGSYGVPQRFGEMFKALIGTDKPTVAVVVSEESRDYRPEMSWLCETMRRDDILDAYLCAPQDIVFTEEALFVRLPDGREQKIDGIYRNFELFDLLNVPKQELMLYAARHQRVRITPPPKAQLEEKLAFALLHNPTLANLWKTELGADVLRRLKDLFPETWVIDPRPLPPQAVIAELSVMGETVNDWMQLLKASK